MISNSTLKVSVNNMDKIVKIELAKKALLFIFVLIATFSLFMLFGSYFISELSSIFSTSTSFILVFVMIIFAIVVKYIGDIIIVALDRDRLNEKKLVSD